MEICPGESWACGMKLSPSRVLASCVALGVAVLSALGQPSLPAVLASSLVDPGKGYGGPYRIYAARGGSGVTVWPATEAERQNNAICRLFVGRS